MSAAPLRVTVYPNLQTTGAGGDPFINQMMNAMRETVASDDKDQDGWNPLGLGLFNLPSFNLNANLLWIFALLAVVSILLLAKRK